MKRRLVIVTEIISPYRIPLFNALAQNPDVDLHVIFLGDTDPKLRQWQVYKQEINFSYQVLPSWRKRIGKYNALLNFGIQKALDQSAPEVVLCGGYSYIASWQALRWARRNRVRFLLWSESNLQDMRRRYRFVEFLKKQFLKRSDGFVVPGRSALEYLRAQGIGESRISIAPNAVDNDLFAKAAESARRNALALRRELALPDRYFLFVGRLVREKGIFELISAYSNLSEQLRREIGFVFVGDGEARQELQSFGSSISPGNVRFVGFVQREQLGAYYGLAAALVLPTYTDTWGMVVNEAMACGLPVIVSRAAGCAADLVHENRNGLLVTTRDLHSLETAIATLAQRRHLCEAMGACSAQYIQSYSPEEWSASIVRTIQKVGESA
jgi:glycosyltransferase involved in cell wall biosynthesis